jgi:hypothetical protein
MAETAEKVKHTAAEQIVSIAFVMNDAYSAALQEGRKIGLREGAEQRKGLLEACGDAARRLIHFGSPADQPIIDKLIAAIAKAESR